MLVIAVDVVIVVWFVSGIYWWICYYNTLLLASDFDATLIITPSITHIVAGGITTFK